jgi:type IV pilus modification protein PilV
MSIKNEADMFAETVKGAVFTERGFTLLEILIAVSIFAIGVLAVASMQVSAIRGNRLGSEVTQATILAQDKLEELKNSVDIASVPDSSDQQGIFTRSWQITPATGDSRLATVTVTWTVGGASHNMVLRTFTTGGGH